MIQQHQIPEAGQLYIISKYANKRTSDVRFVSASDTLAVLTVAQVWDKWVSMKSFTGGAAEVLLQCCTKYHDNPKKFESNLTT